jgi:hypothetical protein
MHRMRGPHGGRWAAVIALAGPLGARCNLRLAVGGCRSGAVDASVFHEATVSQVTLCTSDGYTQFCSNLRETSFCYGVKPFAGLFPLFCFPLALFSPIPPS